VGYGAAVAPRDVASNRGGHDDDDDDAVTLILLRHGESEWNKAKRFTGWLDIRLTDFGEEQARYAGRLLAENRLTVDEAFTSLLCRASKTMELALEESAECQQQQQQTPPQNTQTLAVTRSWQLNERHYGALTGLRKDEVKEKLSKEMLNRYRRDFDTPPVLMESTHPFHAACHDSARYGARRVHASVKAAVEKTRREKEQMNDLVRRGGVAAPSSSFYAPPASSFSSSTDTHAINDDAINNRHSVTEEEEDEEEAGLIPMGESLSQCHDRIAAFFDETVAPSLRSGKTVLVAAHNNVLRSLMTHLDEVDQRSPEGQIEVPKAVPIVYRLNRRSLRPCHPFVSAASSSSSSSSSDDDESQCWTPLEGSAYSSPCMWDGFSATFLGDELEQTEAFDASSSLSSSSSSSSSSSFSSAPSSGVFQETPLHDQQLELATILSQDAVRHEVRKMNLPESSIPYLASSGEEGSGAGGDKQTQQEQQWWRSHRKPQRQPQPQPQPQYHRQPQHSLSQPLQVRSYAKSQRQLFNVQSYFENIAADHQHQRGTVERLDQVDSFFTQIA
jgi:bisphosphoglycerate-dependent phosphoglycerate mutase